MSTVTATAPRETVTSAVWATVSPSTVAWRVVAVPTVWPVKLAV